MPSLLQDPLSAFTIIIKYSMPINIMTFSLIEYPNNFMFMYKIRQHKNKTFMLHCGHLTL